jgi:hypothetical protein
MTTTVATATMIASAGVCSGTTDRSAMTISLHIAASVVIAAKKIDIRPRISAVIVTVIDVAASVTAASVTHTSHQENRENKHKRVTKFH